MGLLAVGDLLEQWVPWNVYGGLSGKCLGITGDRLL
jgi:hypothetical protein